MGDWCVAVPALPGKVDVARKEVPEHLSANLAEYAESRRRAGVTMERVYHMPTPMGDLIVLYGEAGPTFRDVMQAFVDSDLEVDRYLTDAWGEVFGLDLRSQPAPQPDLVWDYVDGSLPRGRGLAFAAPIQPGRTEELRAFFEEAASRRDDLQASRRAIDNSRDRAWVLNTPMGDICCVYIEADDPVASNERFAASREPYDVWFKEKAGAIFGLDFNQPLPLIEQIWDWSAA